MKSKLMTERAAWLYLARCWDAAVPDKYFGRAALIGNYRADGICYSICALNWFEKVAQAGKRRMDKMMAENRPKDTPHTFWWPRTVAGAKKRAAFCRKMAALCKKTK